MAFGAGRVHRVGNGGPAPASSIHVYSPPELPLTYYTSEPAVAARVDAR